MMSGRHAAVSHARWPPCVHGRVGMPECKLIIAAQFSLLVEATRQRACAVVANRFCTTV